MNLNQAQLQTIHAAMKRIEVLARYNEHLIEAALLGRPPMAEEEVTDLRYHDLQSNISKMFNEFQIAISVLIYRK
jgi:hypothetical protein